MKADTNLQTLADKKADTNLQAMVAPMLPVPFVCVTWPSFSIVYAGNIGTGKLS